MQYLVSWYTKYKYIVPAMAIFVLSVSPYRPASESEALMIQYFKR